MESLIVLLVLLLLALPVLAIVAIVMSVGTRDRVRPLEHQLRTLEQRVLSTERALKAAPERPPVPEPEPGPIPAGPPEPVAPATAAPTVPAFTEEAPPESVAPAEPVDAGSPVAPPSRAPVPPIARAAAAAPGMSLEERIGTQWAVWVGGTALALGGIFSVRYSIQVGWIGPGVRIVFGALFALALIVAGEWARRSERLAGISGLPSAHIPGVLTAAGTTVAYADVYAAFYLYEFISAGTAFILLGLVALATLAAALLHGPALAGLGLIGAYVTPVLVSTGRADYWALYLYLAVVTAAAFALARVRMWRWLALTAIAFSLLWAFPGMGRPPIEALGAHAFHVIVGFALAAVLIVSGLLFGPDAQEGKIDDVSSVALGGYLLAAAFLTLASRHDPVALATFALLAAATVAIAWRTEAAAGAVPIAALLVAFVMARWALNYDVEYLIAPSGPTAPAIPEPALAHTEWHLALGIGFALLFGGAGFLAQGRSERALVPTLWAAVAVFTPIAILAALYYRVAKFEPSLPFAGAALLLAALCALATETLGKRAPRPGSAAAEALFATGAVAALALALTMALEKGWLTVALALMVPGIAWVSLARPLPTLRWLIAAIGVLVLARIGWEPRIVGNDVGTTPVFNWLLYGYGIPAAAFWLGGHLMRRRADDQPARMIEAGALLLTVLTVFLEIRHYINSGDIYRPSAHLTELALQVCAGLAMTIGLEHLRRRTGSVVHNVGALIIAALTLVAIVFGLGLGENPMVTGRPVGGPFVNLILLGYGLPAVLTAGLALHARGVRSKNYSATAAVVAVALALSYLTLEVRTLYHGEVLTRGPTGDAEQYTYSAVWLTFGVILLAVGVVLRSQAVRMASAAVVFLTVLKVFLIDMRDLTGIYQGLSFIGLGTVLLGIGLFYQRLLFPRRPPAGASPT